MSYLRNMVYSRHGELKGTTHKIKRYCYNTVIDQGLVLSTETQLPTDSEAPLTYLRVS